MLSFCLIHTLADPSLVYFRLFDLSVLGLRFIDLSFVDFGFVNGSFVDAVMRSRAQSGRTGSRLGDPDRGQDI